MVTAANPYRDQRTQYDPGMGMDELCDALNLGLYIGVTAPSGAAPTISSAIISFLQSGSGAQARTIQAVERAVARGGDFDTNANFLTAAALLTEKFAVGELTVRGIAGVYLPDQSTSLFEGSIAFGNGLRNLTATVAGTDGRLNTIVGKDAGIDMTTGRYNTGVGNGALRKVTTGISNTAVGTSALYENVTANYNTAVGLDALQFNTGEGNTAVGKRSNWQNTSGTFNTSIGLESLQTNVTGASNVAVGYNALYTNTASGNVAVGANAAFSNSSGTDQVAIGNAALYNLSSGNQNVALGNSAGRYHADGLTALTTASLSVYLGYNARGKDNSDSNSIVIGANTQGLGANSVVIGNDNITFTALKGSIGIGTTTAGGKVTIAAAASGVDGEVLRFNRTDDGNRYNSITSISNSGVNSRLYFKVHNGSTATSQTVGLALDGAANVGAGGVDTFGTNAAGVLAVQNNVAPTTGPANTVQFYSTDDSAGNTIPSFFCEGSGVLATGQADSASSVRVKMRINGTVVTLLAI